MSTSILGAIKTKFKKSRKRKSQVKTLFKTVKTLFNNLSKSISMVLFQAITHRIHTTISRRATAIRKRHQEKLAKLRIKEKQHQPEKYIKQTVHNLSSYVLNQDEKKVLSFGLDHHIPSRTKQSHIES